MLMCSQLSHLTSTQPFSVVAIIKVSLLFQIHQQTRAMQGVYTNGTHNTSSVTARNASVIQSTTPGLPTYLREPVAATVFQITVWSTIAFLGVIGNLLVCLVVLGRLRKTSMNYYLLSLAIADLGVLLFIYPVSVARYVSPFRWLLGEHACLYMIPTEEIFFGASIWSITAIAIERYRNIVGAKRYQFWDRSRSRTMLVISVVWLASFLVSSVPLYPVYVYDATNQICQPKWPQTSGKNVMYMTYTSTLIIVWYFLPLAVIAFTYVKIKERVRGSLAFRNSMEVGDYHDQMNMPNTARSRDKRICRKSNKTKRILTPLAILFAVTMFPLNAFRVALLIKGDIWRSPYYKLLFGQIGLFVVINSSCNPLVYYITSKEFKDAFKAIIKGLKERKNIFNQIRRRSRLSSYYSSGRTAAAEKAVELICIDRKNNNDLCHSTNTISSQIGPLADNIQFESTL